MARWLTGCLFALFRTYCMSESKDSLPLSLVTHASSLRVRTVSDFPPAIRTVTGSPWRGGGEIIFSPKLSGLFTDPDCRGTAV